MNCGGSECCCAHSRFLEVHVRRCIGRGNLSCGSPSFRRSSPSLGYSTQRPGSLIMHIINGFRRQRRRRLFTFVISSFSSKKLLATEIAHRHLPHTEYNDGGMVSKSLDILLGLEFNVFEKCIVGRVLLNEMISGNSVSIYGFRRAMTSSYLPATKHEVLPYHDAELYCGKLCMS